MSIKDLLEDFDKNIKPQIEEILRLLKIQQANNITGIIEASAAKVINDLKTVIKDCPCNKEILEALDQRQQRGIILTGENPKPKSGPWKYSYPNDNVGNEELGSSKNTGSLTWPFGVDKKSA